MNRLGLRHRILLAAVIPALLVAAAITLLQTRDQAAQAHVEQHRRLAAIARQLTAIAAYDLFVGNRDALQKLVDAARSDRDIVGIILLDAQDNIMASTLPAEPLPGAEVPHTGFSLDPGNEILEHWHSQTILGSRDMGTDLFVGQASEVPLGQLLLKISNIHLEEDIRAAVLKSAGLAALMLLFAILLAWLLSRSLIQTLAEIGRVVEGVGQGRHDLQVAVPGNDELGQLAIGINRMVTAVGQTHDMLAVRIAAATTT
jgi:two-component system sensor histidine kinase BarA